MSAFGGKADIGVLLSRYLFLTQSRHEPMKQLDSRSGTASMHSSGVLAIIGFIVVACMLSTNNIIARANAGEIPSFSLAFFRWTTVALGLTPFAVHEIKEK